jgi:hypothetical protein
MTRGATKYGEIFNTSAISAARLNADSWPYVPDSVLQI